MILTAHLLTGAAIATKIHNPIMGLFFAFLSHYILDFIPHCEYIPSLKKSSKISPTVLFKIGIDFLIGVFILLLLCQNKFLALIGGFLAILPDFDNLFFIFPWLLKNRFLKTDVYFHLEKIHFFENKKIPLFARILSQVLVILIAIYFLPR